MLQDARVVTDVSKAATSAVWPPTGRRHRTNDSSIGSAAVSFRRHAYLKYSVEGGGHHNLHNALTTSEFDCVLSGRLQVCYKSITQKCQNSHPS